MGSSVQRDARDTPGGETSMDAYDDESIIIWNLHHRDNSCRA